MILICYKLVFNLFLTKKLYSGSLERYLIDLKPRLFKIKIFFALVVPSKYFMS